MTKLGLLYDRLIVQPSREYSAYYQMVRDIIEEMKKDFPMCEEWNQFTEDMKDADVWYDVLDSPEEGKILDYLYEIMEWKKKWFGAEDD